MDIKIIKYFIKILLLVVAIVWFAFAALSGSEKVGILKNLPNVWPWIIFLFFVLVAFWREILGSLLIILFGLFTIIFFSSVFVWFIISLPIIILGCILLFLK